MTEPTLANGPHDHDHLEPKPPKPLSPQPTSLPQTRRETTMSDHEQPEPPAAIHHGLTISALRDELERVKAERDLYLNALVRLRDCDWVVTLPDRMDAVRKIAREAIEAGAKIDDGSPHHARDVLGEATGEMEVNCE
jgi:hypothetical protein